MSPLADALAACHARGRCAFVPFLTAGDPRLSGTARCLRALESAGADIVELGVPFSDPVADGPVIQASHERALRGRTTLTKVLGLLRGLRVGGFKTPVVLFTYLNPVLQVGYAAFAARCAAARAQGVLVVDLPAEESAALSRELRARGVELVLLASPTTSEARLRLIGRSSGSVVYYASREGVTGARRGLAPGLQRRLKDVRRLTGKPLLVGFGVATPAQARALAPAADGVVVGSALVAELAKGAAGNGRLTRLARRLVAGLTLRQRQVRARSR